MTADTVDVCLKSTRLSLRNQPGGKPRSAKHGPRTETGNTTSARGFRPV